jgi:hypothetical protein
VIQITPQMRVLVAIEPVDGRKGIDSLSPAVPGETCRSRSIFRLCVRFSKPQWSISFASSLYDLC